MIKKANDRLGFCQYTDIATEKQQNMDIFVHNLAKEPLLCKGKCELELEPNSDKCKFRACESPV